MSNKTDATWYDGDALPQRIPFQSLAAFDRTAPEPCPEPERPWVSPGEPPWVQARRREPLLFPATKVWTGGTEDTPPPPPPPPPHPTGPKPQWPLAVAVGTLVAVVLILAMAVRSQNVAPAWVPLIGMDSGVAACKAISESQGREIKADGSTPEQVAAVREMFSGSRYPAIRENGVDLMDLAVQIERLGESLAVLSLAGPMITAYSGLAGGCAEQGYTIPPLGP